MIPPKMTINLLFVFVYTNPFLKGFLFADKERNPKKSPHKVGGKAVNGKQVVLLCSHRFFALEQ